MLKFTKIIDAMNDFIAHAESGNLKGTLNAIKNAYLAYLEIDKDPETCEEFRQNLNLMYEKILAKDVKMLLHLLFYIEPVLKCFWKKLLIFKP